MRTESCIAVLLTSLVVFAMGSTDDDDNNDRRVLDFHAEFLHLKHREDKKNSSDDDATEKRSKRSFSFSDRDDVLYNFNYQRSLVGASDMNYLNYDSAFEADLSRWTRGCNYDAEFYSDYDCFVMQSAYPNYQSFANDIRPIFWRTANTFYAATSIYVTRVAGSVDHCPIITVNGTRYSGGGYLRVYGLLVQRSFNQSVQQYTPGEPCTRCQSNVSWCYTNLCRDDCDLSIYGCCQISNGSKTEVCATTTTSTTRTTTPGTTRSTTPGTTTSGTTRIANFNYDGGVPGIGAFGTVIFYGLLSVLCHHFQWDF